MEQTDYKIPLKSENFTGLSLAQGPTQGQTLFFLFFFYFHVEGVKWVDCKKE